MQTLPPKQQTTSAYTVSKPSPQETFVNFEAFYDKYAGAFYGEIKRGLFEEKVSQKVMEAACRKIYQSLHTFDSSNERIFISALKLVKKEISREKVNITLNQILYLKPNTQP